MSLEKATAFAPASVGNVAVGFDVLGFAVDVVGDHVTARRKAFSDELVRIAAIENGEGIPKDPHLNTASVACAELLKDQKADFSVDLEINKGIPLSSGLGGSAASAVAAVVAVNALLPKPLGSESLLNFALTGEQVASGSRHADNVAPSLLGGLQLVSDFLSPQPIPVPEEIFVVLVHPSIKVETQAARSVLNDNISLKSHVKQSAYGLHFIRACYEKDYDAMGLCLRDIIIEPQRKSMIASFDEAQESALKNGALGFSISGAGPTMFAWCRGESCAKKVEAALADFGQTWVTQVSGEGARVLP